MEDQKAIVKRNERGRLLPGGANLNPGGKGGQIGGRISGMMRSNRPLIRELLVDGLEKVYDRLELSLRAYGPSIFFLCAAPLHRIVGFSKHEGRTVAFPNSGCQKSLIENHDHADSCHWGNWIHWSSRRQTFE